jgi:RimJ/RimL family protein N-acetyltransferase
MIHLGNKMQIAAWVRSHIEGPEGEFDASEWYDAIGFASRLAGLCGGVIYHNATDYNVNVIAAGRGNWLTPLRVKAMFQFPFEIMGVEHISTYVPRRNKKSRKFDERLGFKLEGVLRNASSDGHDVFAYGMLKSECKWIEKNGFTLRERSEAA